MEETIHDITERMHNFYNMEVSGRGEKISERLVTCPGERVEVSWLDGNVDLGYMFSLPGQSPEEGDVFVHFLETSNIGGIDGGGPVWIHLTDLLNNTLVKGIKNIQ